MKRISQNVKQRYRPYPEYKDSGIEWLGEIPAHWHALRYRFLGIINPSSIELSNTPSDLEVSFVPMEALGEWGGLSLESTKQISEVSSGYTYFRNGDVLTAKIKPCFENGKGAVANNLTNEIGFGTTELHVLRPSEMLDNAFLAYLTYSRPFRELGQSEMKGVAGQQRVPENFIKDFVVPFPSDAEQKDIIFFLDRETAKIDAMVEKKKRLIELLKEKRTALITQAVTKGLNPNVPMKDSGIEWLGEIPAHWEVMTLKKIGELQAGAGFPDEEQGVIDEDIPFFKVGDLGTDENKRELIEWQNTVSRPTARKLRAFIFPERTTVFAKVGAALKLNRRRLLVRPSCIDNNMMGFIPFTCDPLWALYWLSGLDMGGIANPGAVPSVNEGQMRDMPAIVPPLSEQRAIATFLDRETAKIDALVEKIGEALDRLKEYRTALISAAVTGKIDVRGEVA